MSTFQSKAAKPLLGDSIRPLKDFFADTCVVQDYPERYVTPQNGPRKHHESFHEGNGFLYGIRTDNAGKHWTRCLLFKPSELLLEKWGATIGNEGSGKIQALTIEHMPQSQIMRVQASYMDMIGSKVIGYITENDYKQMRMAVWTKELGEAI